jgi:hypothetical protein
MPVLLLGRDSAVRKLTRLVWIVKRSSHLNDGDCTRVQRLKHYRRFKTRGGTTTFKVMPVIPKPPGRGPMFGAKSMILLDGYDKDAMRRWRDRLHDAERDQPDGRSADDNATD